ncbi:MAG: hypothetical protein ACXABN_18850, partial [Candidatus Thorarchaeota archaeon]
PSIPSWIVVSMMWQVVFEQTIIPLFDPVRLILILPLTFIRFAVPITMTRLYQNKTTTRRALMIIIASEIQPVILYDIPLFLFAVYQGFFPFFIPFMIPIPLLALTSILILWLYPPPKREVEWIEQSKQDWWQDSSHVQ